jgi:hypothetical protein
MHHFFISVGFYLYLDGADFRRPAPVDPDSIDIPEPDELLAQQMGVAASSIARKPSSGPLHKLPLFDNGVAKTMPLLASTRTSSAFLISPPVASYLYGQNYATQLASYTSNLNSYPSSPSGYNTYKAPSPQRAVQN